MAINSQWVISYLASYEPIILSHVIFETPNVKTEAKVSVTPQGLSAGVQLLMWIVDPIPSHLYIFITRHRSMRCKLCLIILHKL